GSKADMNARPLMSALPPKGDIRVPAASVAVAVAAATLPELAVIGMPCTVAVPGPKGNLGKYRASQQNSKGCGNRTPFHRPGHSGRTLLCAQGEALPRNARARRAFSK